MQQNRIALAASGMTRAENSSSDAQMSSCRLLPPCWMKTVWSTPASSNWCNA